MRVVYAGTPEFAAQALAALLEAGHRIPLVLTQPDRPAGRGLRHGQSAVKQLAQSRGIEVFQPAELRSPANLERVAQASPEVLVVAAYGLILPEALLGLARHGALNIHASLLPRWRGAAPIQRALMAGDAETGITIMRMDAGLDTGPMYAQERIGIRTDDDAGTLHDRLAGLGARMIVEALANIASGVAQATPQPATGVTYARKLDRSDRELDWLADADQLERTVRALRPTPCASTVILGEAAKIWRSETVAVTGRPGVVLYVDARGVVVACGRGGLRVTELQRAGGKRMPAADFARGHALVPGMTVGTPVAPA